MYGKIFDQIFDSSIADDYQLRHFFMDLIVLADSDGVVNKTPAAISARTRIPLPIVSELLKRLTDPDPESQTPDADGRRIELIDEHRTWGWHIINYEKYRNIATDEQRRVKTRERVKRFKLKRKELQEGNAEVTQGNAEVTPPYASASSSVSGDWGVGKGEIGVFQEMVSKFMSRPSDEHWTYAELSALAQVAKRPKHVDEMRQLQDYKKRMKDTQFFPRSVASLLEKWGSTLDQSRQKFVSDDNQKMINKAIPPVPTYDDED